MLIQMLLQSRDEDDANILKEMKTKYWKRARTQNDTQPGPDSNESV